MEFKTNRIDELSTAEYMQCRSLNMRNNGTMQRTFAEERRKGKALVHRCLEDDILLGWVLEFDSYLFHRAYFYVRQSHRRKGIGRQLALMVERKAKVSPWNETAKSFFSSIGEIGNDVQDYGTNATVVN